MKKRFALVFTVGLVLSLSYVVPSYLIANIGKLEFSCWEIVTSKPLGALGYEKPVYLCCDGSE